MFGFPNPMMIQNNEPTAQNQHYRGRVRSGCFTCRSRKVKCDEGRPVCQNCSRIERQCRYKIAKPQQRLATVVPNPRDATTNAAAQSSSLSEPQCTSSSPSLGENVLPDQHYGTTTASLDVENSLRLGSGSVQDSFLCPDSTIVDATYLRYTVHLHSDRFIPTPEADFEPVSTAAMVSHDITLTTTMDKLTAQTAALQPSLSFFAESVHCHSITPYDSINWHRMKTVVVKLSAAHEAIASAVVAVSTLHKAQRYGLPTSNATNLYRTAKVAYERSIGDAGVAFEIIMITAFLLCLFEFEFQEITEVFMTPHKEFVKLLTREVKQANLKSELSLRLCIWLRLLHVTASRAGGTGILSPAIYDLLPDIESSLPNLKPSPGEDEDASSCLVEMLNGPIFEFYMQIQMISAEIASLTHYRRSRSTGLDQEEVNKELGRMRSKLHSLWESRCPTQRQTPADLRRHFSPAIAEPVITLMGLCVAAYHAEYVEIHRVLGDPVSTLSEPRQCMQQIRETIDGDWNLRNGFTLNMGLLRPLFLYAIECREQDENEWAVSKLEEIKDLWCRSRFFAAFGKALFDAQQRKDRRVTSKYFCIWFFGVPPPYL